MLQMEPSSASPHAIAGLTDRPTDRLGLFHFPPVPLPAHQAERVPLSEAADTSNMEVEDEEEGADTFDPDAMGFGDNNLSKLMGGREASMAKPKAQRQPSFRETSRRKRRHSICAVRSAVGADVVATDKAQWKASAAAGRSRAQLERPAHQGVARAWSLCTRAHAATLARWHASGEGSGDGDHSPRDADGPAAEPARPHAQQAQRRREPIPRGVQGGRQGQ